MTDTPEANASNEDGLEVLRVVLPEMPAVRWSVSIHWVKGQPEFLRLDFRSTQPGSHVSIPMSGYPWARLIGIWCLWHGLHRDGTPIQRGDLGNADGLELWEALCAPPRHLPRRPQQTKNMSDDEHRELMAQWSEPIATIILVTTVLGDPARRAVAEHFHVGQERAKQLIDLARTNHPYLPQATGSQPRPATDRRERRDTQ